MLEELSLKCQVDAQISEAVNYQGAGEWPQVALDMEMRRKKDGLLREVAIFAT